jgi:hypothetical protein
MDASEIPLSVPILTAALTEFRDYTVARRSGSEPRGVSITADAVLQSILDLIMETTADDAIEPWWN